LITAYTNTDSVGTETTIQLRNINSGDSVWDVKSWSIADQTDPSKWYESGRKPGENATNDTITDNKDDAKTATLKMAEEDDNRTDSTLSYLSTNRGAIRVRANLTLDLGSSDAPQISILIGGGLKKFFYGSELYQDQIVYFNIYDGVPKRVVQQMIDKNKQKIDADSKKSEFKITGLNITWAIRYRTTDKKFHDLDSVTHDLGYDPNTWTDEDMKDFEFQYNFSELDENGDYVNSESGANEKFVNATITLNYEYYYSGGLLGYGKGTKQATSQYQTNTSSDQPRGMAPDDIPPEITIKNNLQVDDQDEKNDPSGLKVKDVEKGDLLNYQADISIKADDDQSQPIGLNDSIYTVPIPKDVSVDKSTVSMYETSNPANVIGMAPDFFDISPDPNDSSRNLLTLKGINIPGVDRGKTRQFTLKFQGKADDVQDSTFNFVPDFKGQIGINHDQTPIYDSATGEEQSISYKDAVPVPSGEINLIPKAIDYGTLNAFAPTNAIRHRKNNEDDSIVDINDARTDEKNSQVVRVKQDDALKNENGVALPGGLVFNDPTDNTDSLKPLTFGSEMTILVSNDGEQLQPIKWSKNKGLLLKLNGGAIPTGNYTTRLTWSCVDAPR